MKKQHKVTQRPTQAVTGEQPQPPAASPILLTPQQLADRLSVSCSWVREKSRVRARLRDADPLPIVRLGKYVRFSWQAVEEWLARQSA